MSIEFLNHDADVLVRIRAGNLVSAFKKSGLSVIDYCSELKKIKHVKIKELIFKAKDLKSLLYDFLNEIIFLIDAEFFVFNHYKYLKIKKIKSGYSIETKVLGDDYRKYKTKTHIKSITYNEMLVEADRFKAKIEFVLDI